MTMTNDKSLMPLARAAERRLGRLHVWAAIRQRVTWIAGAAAAGAILRPFVWPLHHQAPLLSAESARVGAMIGTGGTQASMNAVDSAQTHKN